MIERLLKNNLFVKIIAFFLALILWFYVTGDRLPDTQGVTRTIANVPLAWRNLDERLEIMQIPSEVDVIISGNSDIIYGIRPQEMEVYVDLRNIGEGTHRLTPNALVPRGIRVENFRPTQVTVVLEEVILQQKAITLLTTGRPASGLVQGEPILEPDQVFIRGPQSALPEVFQIRVIADIDGLESDFDQELSLFAVDQFEKPLEDVVINPETVRVIIPIKEPQKEIPVDVPLEGEPASDYQVVSVSVTPATVLATAKQAVLDEVRSVSTPPVDISNASESIRQELTLNVPEEVKLSQTIVEVEIIIEPLER